MGKPRTLSIKKLQKLKKELSQNNILGWLQVANFQGIKLINLAYYNINIINYITIK